MQPDGLPLKQMQVYVGREMVEEFRAGRITRRTLMKRLILICGGTAGASALLAACDKDVSDMGGGNNPPGGSAGGDAGVPGSGGPPALSVKADDPALTTSKVTFPGPAGMITGYLARPKAVADYPAVLVIHENRGLNDHIRDVARRVAKANFVALAPDLTSRWGTTEMLDPDMARMHLSGADPNDLVADLSASIDHLLTQSRVAPAGKVGVVGFCLGGGYTLRLCASNAKVVAAVPYYGPAPMPIDMMKNTSAAILAHYAEMDTNVNGTRDMLEMVLKTANKTFEKHIHPGTLHAFNNDTGANYHEQAAVEAWGETVAWFNALVK